MQVDKGSSAYRKTSNVIINAGSPTALNTNEVSILIVIVYHIPDGIVSII